jgi:hypothetical protein
MGVWPIGCARIDLIEHNDYATASYVYGIVCLAANDRIPAADPWLARCFYVLVTPIKLTWSVVTSLVVTSRRLALGTSSQLTSQVTFAR